MGKMFGAWREVLGKVFGAWRGVLGNLAMMAKALAWADRRKLSGLLVHRATLVFEVNKSLICLSCRAPYIYMFFKKKLR